MWGKQYILSCQLFIDVIQRDAASSLSSKVHEVLSVACLILGCGPHISVTGQGPASPVRLLVLLEAKGVGHLYRLVLDLLRGQADAHGDDGQSQQAVQCGEGHLDNLDKCQFSTKA